MPESVESPPDSRSALVAPPATSNRTPEKDGGGTLLFPELVLAHHRWFVACADFGKPGGVPDRYAPSGWVPGSVTPDGELRRREDDYRRKLDEFQRREGEIVSAYWSATTPSAVALTLKPPSRLARLLRRQDADLRLHRASNWLTGDDPEIMELLHHCDTLAIKVGLVLRATAKRIAMEWIFTEASYLLGVAEQRSKARSGVKEDGSARADKRHGVEEETEPPATRRPDAVDDAERASPALHVPTARPKLRAKARKVLEEDPVEQAARELVQIERYYDRAADKTARIVYFWGMMVGVGTVAVLGGALALALFWLFDVIDPDSAGTRNFFASYAAGAIGAVLSVLMRMKKEDGVTLDYEVGRPTLMRLGSFRPFIGAVSGVVVYFALQGDLLQVELPDAGKSFYFLTLLAFVAGFSERWMHVIVGGAERTVAATLGEADASAPASRTRR